MKNKMIVLLAGALLTIGMAGNAMAYFTGDDLIRVVYNTTTNVEAVTDLGSMESLIADAPGTVVGNGSASFLNNGITSSTLAGSEVAYFAVATTFNGTAGKYLWVSGDPVTPSGIAGLKFTASGAALQSLIGQWGQGTTTSSYQGTTTGTPSYYVTADKSGTGVGTLDSFMNSASLGSTEANLASLATGGNVSQGLWYFASANNTTATGALALTLQTNADGSTTIDPTATPTPIPPAFFLMGSGLLGMFGLRRKRA